MKNEQLDIRFPEGAARQGECLELRLPIGEQEGNPFNSRELAVTAVFEAPSGRSMRTDGFWYQGYAWSPDGGTLGDPAGEPEWRVRFCPTESGRWQYTIRYLVKGEECGSAQGSFTVEAQDWRGFIRVEPKVRRTFAYENGDLYIPIGQNVAWDGREQQNDTFRFYRDILHRMADNGANYVRIWLAQWNLSLNDYDSMPDDYSRRLDRAAMLDAIFTEAEKCGIAISLVIWSHGQFSRRVNPVWDANTYNVASPGGYLAEPAAFFTDERARQDAKSYLRYIMARYGWSPALMCYELFNEADGAEGSLAVKTAWHREMTAYVRGNDPYGHMVTTSSSYMGDPLLFDPAFDFIYLHSYNVHGNVTSIDQLQMPLWYKYHKPVLYGEIGILIDEYEIDPGLVILHQENWAGLMGGGAGGALNWFWTGMEQVDGYREFAPVASFAARLPLDNPELEQINRYFLGIEDEQIAASGYRTRDSLYVWFYDTQYTYRHTQTRDFAGKTIVTPLLPGNYTVTWIDPYTGEERGREPMHIEGDYTCLPMCSWTRDIAMIILPADK